MKGPALKLAFWQMRGQSKRVWLCMLCIALGVAARTSVGNIQGALDRALAKEARKILTADIEISSLKPFSSQNELAIAKVLSPGSRLQRQMEMITMALVPGENKTRLVELRVIEPDFPFFGNLQLKDPVGKVLHSAKPSELFLDEPHVYVHPDLLIQLRVRPGSSLRIGKLNF